MVASPAMPIDVPVRVVPVRAGDRLVVLFRLVLRRFVPVVLRFFAVLRRFVPAVLRFFAVVLRFLPAVLRFLPAVLRFLAAVLRLAPVERVVRRAPVERERVVVLRPVDRRVAPAVLERLLELVFLRALAICCSS